MSKNKEREGRISKGQRKEVKPVKVNKARGKDNKLVGDEKAGKQDDASKKFPNFSLLSEEERQVFFEALTTARKNLEKKGVPTRQRFGTVHDEYLNHFKTEQESDSEKPAPREPNSVLGKKVSPFRDGSTAFVPQGGDPPQKNIPSDKEKTIPTYCAQLNLSERAKPEVLEQCESVIRQNTNKIIDLYVKRKKKNETPTSEKRGRPEKEKGNQAKENVRKLLVVEKPPKTRNTPRFDALSPEEKEVFFKILDEARNNVVEKNPGKKNEILPLDSIARMYQGCHQSANIFLASQKAPKQEKNLNVKVTLTSGDVRRAMKIKSEKKMEKEVEVEEKKSEGRIKDVEDDNRGENCLEPEDKSTTKDNVKECGDSSEAAEGEASKNFNLEEIVTSEEGLKASHQEKKSKEKGRHSQESKMEISDGGNAEISSKETKEEVESSGRSGNEKSKEDEMEKSSHSEENSEKVTKSPSQVVEEENEGSREKEKTTSSLALTSAQDAEEYEGRSSSSKAKGPQEPESVEETIEKGDPHTPQEKREKLTFSTPKVMFVEDNVIDKIRNLIFYLEAKARKDDRLEKEYIKLLVDYVDYLSRVLEALVLKKNHKQAPFQLQNTYVDAEVHLKFNDDPASQKSQKMYHQGPRSVSGNNIGGNFLADLSNENVTEKVTDADQNSKIEVTMSHSETSVISVNSQDAAFLPPVTGRKKVGLTKIRLLQDLLKKRAEFVEGEDLKIVHHPEEEYIPVERPTSMKAITSESEEHAREDNRVRFFRFLTKCFTCGKKKEEEYGVFENLKGEAVRVVVSEGKNKDPANATLNQSVMEVLKAAGRKKVIEKFYGKG